MTSLYLALAILLAAVVLFVVAARQRRAAGLPGGRVVYTDTRGWGRVEKPLYDSELGLTGKPDYLIEKDGGLIPVEVKTGRTPEAPYDSHIFQVAAYCYLVEKSFGKRPTHGIIHYSSRDFAVDYTPELESALLDLLARIRMDESRAEVHRSHEQEHRCRRCGFREMCDERLT
ncbi:MAG: CRISPR-associated protein Cas4 [Chloroflexi bacterium]|nr:CRISPR-associated protein Cas4 [Chloroflexota bacterium]